jgi:large subunit ribosomal protein L21
MYAVIASGGKQHKVMVGDTIYVEKLDTKDGAKVDFDTLLYADGDEVIVGSPLVKDVKVTGKVVKQVKSSKVIVFKYKPKKNIRKKTGHRQPYTVIEITGIKKADDETKATAQEKAPAKKAPAKKATAQEKAPAKKEPAKKTTAKKTTTAKKKEEAK